MICFDTNTIPIHLIDDKYHMEKLKGYRTGLTGYYVCLLHELLLMPS